VLVLKFSDDLKAEHIIPRSESPEILDETQNGITNSQLKELLRKERVSYKYMSTNPVANQFIFTGNCRATTA
jgi:hypothetical protein